MLMQGLMAACDQAEADFQSWLRYALAHPVKGTLLMVGVAGVICLFLGFVIAAVVGQFENRNL